MAPEPDTDTAPADEAPLTLEQARQLADHANALVAELGAEAGEGPKLDRHERLVLRLPDAAEDETFVAPRHAYDKLWRERGATIVRSTGTSVAAAPRRDTRASSPAAQRAAAEEAAAEPVDVAASQPEHVEVATAESTPTADPVLPDEAVAAEAPTDAAETDKPKRRGAGQRKE